MDKKMAVNEKEYKILKLLGKGKGGYSYLASDETRKYVLKQIHHEPCDYYQFGNKIKAEINDYNRLKETGIKIPDLIDVDIENERILKEFIDGETVYELIVRDNMRSAYIDQLHKMCVLLYAAHTNIDYFPTNFIPHGGILWYVDYECNSYMEQCDDPHWGRLYWSKTPELLAYAERERGV